MITPETIQKIKDAAHIEEVVSRFLPLRRRGTNLVACCPFHQEKTGSFNVNPARNIYKCFGCGKSGDSISFLMEHDHKTYPEALRYLADMYGIEIEEEEVSDEVRARQHERDSLLRLTHFAQQHFASQLTGEELRARGLTPEVAHSFGLGLKSSDDFARYALSQGYSPQTLTATGLADSDLNDLLPAGLIYPIYSRDGKPISFISRHDRWTFLSPSPLFDYGRALLGFYQAKKAIPAHDRCYLVTHFEVLLSMHQAGITHTVAPCSAAVTEQQVKDIRRFTRNITLVCSPAAAERFDAAPLLSAGIHLRLVLFPAGQTPDTYARQHGSTQLEQYLHDEEQNFILHRASQHIQLHQECRTDLPTCLAALTHLLHQLPDPLEREAYLPHLAASLQIPEPRLRHDLHL